jgi:hypothetical protein
MDLGLSQVLKNQEQCVAVERTVHLEWDSLSFSVLTPNSNVTLDKSQNNFWTSVSHMKEEGGNQMQADYLFGIMILNSSRWSWWLYISYVVKQLFSRTVASNMLISLSWVG